MEKQRQNKLYLDPIGGIAGDMFSAAFINAGLIDIQTLKKNMALFDPDINLIYEQSQQSAITGGKLRVLTPQGEENTHTLQHHHQHDHEHYPFSLIRKRLLTSALPKNVVQLALAIFTRLAQAESKLHNVPLDELSFHEVGRDDAIADIISAAVCVCALPASTKIICGPVPLGRGEIQFSHGIFPVPAPATAEILRGIPVIAGRGQYEMTTPTGAAIVATICQEFVSAMPSMNIKMIGYGNGHIEPAGFPNSLRLFYGETSQREETAKLDYDEVIELTCNIDDQPGNLLAPSIEQFLQAGAIDVFCSSYHGKKGRMGQQWVILVPPEQESFFSQMMLYELGTIGLRASRVWRYKLPREMKVYMIDNDECRAKKVYLEDGWRVYPETDDIIYFSGKWAMSLLQTSGKLHHLIHQMEEGERNADVNPA